MEVISDPRAMQALCWEKRCAGKRLALVPTMGFFHEGHLSLMRHAREHADLTAVSLFVNPTQFGPNEDLDRYPRNFERDCELAAGVGVDLLFVPRPADMYDPRAATWVEVPSLAANLCGRSRPGHFRGVATVVTKLLNLAVPSLAVFGEKDWQQLAIIRRLVADLNLPTTVVGRPIVREADGLAMSSRNANLGAEERAQAPTLRRGLLRLAALAAAGETEVSVLAGVFGRELEGGAPLAELDYLEFVHAETLQPLKRLEESSLVAVAARFPSARLIDNLRLGPAA